MTRPKRKLNATVAAILLTIFVMFAALVMLLLSAVRAKADGTATIGCQTIGYQINATDATNPQAVTAIRDAVTMIQVRTGNTYRYDGLTTQIPTRASVQATQTEQLIIAVATKAQTDVIDTGQSAATFWWQTYGTIQHTAIVFDTAYFNAYPSGLDFAVIQPNEFKETEHELGHSVGLDHSPNPGDIMRADWWKGPIFYSANDSARLAANGCQR